MRPTPTAAAADAMPSAAAEPYDHTAGVPELRLSGRVNGRPAALTLSPGLPATRLPGARGVRVRVDIRYRIALAFTAPCSLADDGSWQVHTVRSLQDPRSVSVRVVQPYVSEAIVTVLRAHREEITPLLQVVREQEAACALAVVQRARHAVDQAQGALARAEDDFTRLGIAPARAAEVLGQLRHRRERFWPGP